MSAYENENIKLLSINLNESNIKDWLISSSIAPKF